MARSHLCRINHLHFGPSRAGSDAPSRTSARFAHLGCMETTPSPATSPTTVPGNDAAVITDVFESALSVQELAAQLHVSAQTIYDLRSQGRGPTGFRVGRHLRFRTSEIEAWLSRLEGEDCDRHPSGEAR